LADIKPIPGIEDQNSNKTSARSGGSEFLGLPPPVLGHPTEGPPRNGGPKTDRKATKVAGPMCKK